jgi:hypothetical protein
MGLVEQTPTKNELLARELQVETLVEAERAQAFPLYDDRNPLSAVKGVVIGVVLGGILWAAILWALL